jgi:hypothetical protein
MKSNSKTPRTDGAASETIIGIYHEPNFVDADFARQLELENAELLETLKKAERELSRLFEKISINGVLPSPSVMQDCVYVINKLTRKSND